MWKVTPDEKTSIINITPVGEDHKDGGFCKCNPMINIENGWKIFTHKSFDGREYKEPNNKNEIIKA